MVSPSWPIEQIDVWLPTLDTLARRPPSSPPPSVLVSDCEAGSPGLWWHSRKTCLWSWMASAGEARQGHGEVGEQWCRFNHTTIDWPQSLNQWCHFVQERESLAGLLICLGFIDRGKPKNRAEVEFKDKGDFIHLYQSWKSQEPSCPRPLTWKKTPQLGVFICTQSVPFCSAAL